MGFDEIYDRYFARVYGFVRCRLDGAEAAEDVVSRIFERVLDKLDSYHPDRGPFEAWLFTLAGNVVADHYRARRWLSWLPLEAAGDRPESAPLIEDDLAERERRTGLLEALRSLDERQREVLALKFEARMSNQEIAAMTGLSESHVGVLIYRAVRKLKDLLAEEKTP